MRRPAVLAATIFLGLSMLAMQCRRVPPVLILSPSSGAAVSTCFVPLSVGVDARQAGLLPLRVELNGVKIPVGVKIPMAGGALTVNGRADVGSPQLGQNRLEVFTRLGNGQLQSLAQSRFTYAPQTDGMQGPAGTVDFGDVSVGSSGFQSFAIENTGLAALDVTGVAASAAPFEVFPPAVFAIADCGVSRSISIGFSPTATGLFEGSIAVSTASGAQISVPVKGIGVASGFPLAGDLQSALSLEFGGVAEGSSQTRELTLTNAGDSPIQVGPASTGDAAFSVSATAPDSLPLLIEPKASANLTVTFTPPADSAGTNIATQLAITSDDPANANIRSVSLSGNALPQNPPLLDNPVADARVLNPADLSSTTSTLCSNIFGEVVLGAGSLSSDSFVVTLVDRNGASASSTPLSATQGAGAASFSGIDACSLADGVIAIEVAFERDGVIFPPVAGTPAVRSTGSLAPPMVNPVDRVSFLSTIQLCGTADPGTGIVVTGGVGAEVTDTDAAGVFLRESSSAAEHRQRTERVVRAHRPLGRRAG